MQGRSPLLLLLYFGIFFSATRLEGQTYPAALVTTLNGPRTLFLDEYTDPFQPKIRTTIFFTDFTESSWNFSLKLKITGPNGIVIQTRPDARPLNPLAISPGQPFIIEGADLSFYFNYNNLIFSGISRAQLEINNRLPEGLYTFCFEAIDYESSKPLSHPSCISSYLSLNDPPIIVSPVCGSVVENIAFQNVLFQWQVSNSTGNLNLSQLNYQIDLYEVNNSWSNPVTAIINNQALPIWQSSPLSQNNYLYTNIDPPLSKGKRYVYTVKAIAANGRNSFKNNGVSTPCYFHYGYFENDTIDIIKPVDNFQFALSTPSQFKWKKPRKALPSQMLTYTLKLVEVGPDQDPENAIISNTPFYQQSYLPVNDAITDKTIPVTFWMNIKRMGHYAWQVYAQSGSQEVAKSPLQIFTGPPAIETFIAGGFLMTIVKLDTYDTINHVISGRCKTSLNSAFTDPVEFDYNNITLTSIGNNEWVMSEGSISSSITCPSYTLPPKTFADNKNAFFKADSVFVNTSGLKLSGITEWNFPHAGTGQQVEKITSVRNRLTLANSSFYLNNNELATLSNEYKIPILEPFGFKIKINKATELSIYQSKYEFNFGGFIELPPTVLSENGPVTNISFGDVNNLHYIVQDENLNSESIKLAQNTNFGFLPTSYTVDLYERKSPAEFSTDSAWKGICIEKGLLQLPKTAEASGQITLPFAKTFSFTNTVADTNKAYINYKGLFFTATVPFERADSVKFNSFGSKLGYFYAKISESTIDRAFVSGGIYIPVMDTVNSFPYFIEMTDFGFNEGYLVNGLANRSFTFNAAGGAEQKIPITIKRAVFKGRNHLEMDLDMSWPYFNLNLTGVQRFSVWGNGNIGFDVPNGKAALTYQATGKASNFDITVDYLGCGRNGNAYAFGASAKINMDEEISGEDGPPVINAYSIYKNPLLLGMVYVPPPTTTTPVAPVTTPSTPVYQSSTGSYTSALGGDLAAAFGSGQNPLTSTVALNLPADSINNDPLIKNNLITDLGKIVQVIYRLKPLIQEVTDISDDDWAALDILNMVLQSDVAKKAEVLNGKELMNYVLKKVLNEIVNRINQPIQDLSDKAMAKVRTAINTRVVLPINTKIDKSLTSVFDKLEVKIKLQVDEQYHGAVKAVFTSVKTNVVSGIKLSVANSFEANITSKITGFVQQGVTIKIKNFISTEVTAAGLKLINEGANANINLAGIMQNSGTMFESIADTIKDVIMNISGANLLNTGESLVEDAINNIDWNAISTQILNELIAKGLSSAIASGISQVVGSSAGPYVNAVLSTVKFDFNNVGEKLRNGQFDKIVSFDPTTIYMVTPAVNIRGSLTFTKDDPVFGDSWQADVQVTVKVPKKDNPIECTAFFLNGKTTQQPQNFTYWFVKLGIMGLNIPLNPMPIIWDGAEGYAFSKMKKTGPVQVVPDITNKFGVGCKFFFYDQASTGKTYIFGLGANAEFNQGGFSIELVGDASVLNYQKNTAGKYNGPGFVTGTGVLGYYKTPECSKIAGKFNVTLNTEPIICAGGEIGLDLKSPNDWKAWVGTQQTPIGVKILCKDFLSNTAFMQVGNTGFTAGLAMNVSLSAQSPWLEFSQIKVRGFTSLNLGYNAYTSISWDPTFKINEASVSAWVSAAIGIQYETSVTSNSLTLAGVALAGTLTYKSDPESELHGEMSGSITVLNYSLGFQTPVHYSLSKQEIIN